MPWILPLQLWLRRDCQAADIDSFENGIATAGEQCGSGGIAESFRIVSIARVAEEFGAVGGSDDRFQVKLAVTYFGESTDWDLAASAEAVEQGALARGGSAGVRVIQEG